MMSIIHMELIAKNLQIQRLKCYKHKNHNTETVIINKTRNKKDQVWGGLTRWVYSLLGM